MVLRGRLEFPKIFLAITIQIARFPKPWWSMDFRSTGTHGPVRIGRAGCRYNAAMVKETKNKSQVLIYDANCRLCDILARWLSRADILNQINWTSYQSLDEPPPGLTWDDLKRSAYLLGGEDQHYEGFYAFRMLTIRLPLLAPLALIFWFPGVGVIGSALYRWVARNRYRLFGCS